MRSFNRRWRSRIGWIALVSFWFAQVAIAAYVCPDANDSATLQQTPSGQGDCHRSGGHLKDTGNAQLCKAYCERGAQVKPSAWIDPPDLVALAVPAPLGYFEPALASERPERCLSSSGDPPLYLRNCVLRN